MRLKALLITAAALVALPATASAFCGFYVSGAGADLFNDATQVVLLRDGTKTVLSMQNSYKGPPENFAMVVPVPVVLQEENVKTLPAEIFARVDKLAAPRLVEYWEMDPCKPEVRLEMRATRRPSGGVPSSDKSAPRDLGVTIEAEFTVGEYDIVILSAKDSTGLDTWLKQKKYKIPDGAEPYLRPYVESGSKFFVARVDTSKVTFEKGRAMLSPLRFHYDSKDFRLPVRLGLINADGAQDIIVHILARGQRYEVANYPNVTIPTNLDVREAAKERFGEFYAALFDRTLEKNKGAVVTEYAWNAASCDPCPIPALTGSDLMTLGLDVVSGMAAAKKPVRRARSRVGGWTLTRLHARYTKASLGEDLVFTEAEPIMGGREVRGADGNLEEGAQKASVNNFQARYAIRHEWEGKIECENPVRGRWGGPPGGAGRPPQARPATNLAFAPRGKVVLAEVVKGDIPELQVAASPPRGGDDEPGSLAPEHEPEAPSSDEAKKKSDKGCAAAGDAGAPGVLLLFAAVLWMRRGRRRP